MEFITENYLWIVIIIIVVAMAVVGYVAEKKDFIKKGVKVEKTKKEKEQPIVIENKGIDELLKDAVDKDSKKKKDKKKKEEVSVEESVLEPIAETIAEPVFETNNLEVNNDHNVNEDLTSPLVSEPVVEDNTVDESLFAPLGETQNTELNTIEVSTLPEEESVVNSEEDIWKF